MPAIPSSHNFQNFPKVGRICSAHANLGLNTTLPLELSLLHFIDTDRGCTMCLYTLHAQLSQSSIHSTSALHSSCKSFNFQSALSKPIQSCIWSAVEPTAYCCFSLPQYRLMQRVISALTWPPPCCNTKFHNELRLMLPLRVDNDMRVSKDRKDISRCMSAAFHQQLQLGELPMKMQARNELADCAQTWMDQSPDHQRAS